nr:hypothetical protein BaRGS_005169 [Batillaria attramentaria]
MFGIIGPDRRTRVGEVHQLNEGDRVTFGHKNGVNVKVGETALQADSEFQYVNEVDDEDFGENDIESDRESIGLGDTSYARVAAWERRVRIPMVT